jgi:hypothetical protein
MFKMLLIKIIPLTCSSLYAASLLACSPGDGNAQTTGDNHNLSIAERSVYVADSQYLHSITRPDVAVRLNLADPRQHRFAMARLNLAGKTAINSPHLFELIEARREAQVARGLKAGAFAEAVPAVTSGVVAMHYIEATNVGVSRTPAQLQAAGAAAIDAPVPQVSATASSTFPGGTDYTYADISITTIDGAAIGPLGAQENFGDGTNVTVSTAGDPRVARATRYTFESYKYEQVGDDFVDSYIHTEAGSLVLHAPVGTPLLSVPEVDAPIDIRGPNIATPDGVISVCMDRAWTNDCDYILNTGSVTDHRIKMPLKGAVKITTQHVFDATKIQQLQTALAAGQDAPWGPGLVKLVLTNVGGGCDVDAANALNAGMSGFWNYVTLSADNKTLYWDATGADAIYFDEGCTQIQNFAKLTMRIPTPVLSLPLPGVAFIAPFTITNDPNTLRPDKTIPPITLTNSCLAEGTQIEVGGGKLAAIESLEIGQAIFNPYAGAGQLLTIQDTAKGTEAAPMVRIGDDAGHTLLMTEMHPIATSDRGMVQARSLRTGDVVMTTRGPSKLVEVRREAYSGKVYNLKVGSQAELANLGRDQTVVYANGFVVGDGQIQSKYEALSLTQGSHKTLDQLPEAWRRDYLMSNLRK